MIDSLLVDAGYDAEWAHQQVRAEFGIGLICPPKIGRPTNKPPSGRYRMQMARCLQRPFEQRRHGQRWQVKTAFDMMKRQIDEATHR